jgi:hypothetical protein
MMRGLLVAGILPALCLCVPVEHDGLNFHNLEARQQNLPTIKLPYGTWQASKYDAANDVRPISSQLHISSSQPLDLYVQEHPIRRPSSWRPTVRKTCTSNKERYAPDRRIWWNVCTKYSESLDWRAGAWGSNWGIGRYSCRTDKLC